MPIDSAFGFMTQQKAGILFDLPAGYWYTLI